MYRETATPAPETPPLEGRARSDLAVVGGGITGVSVALHAAAAGLDVVVLEAQEVGYGASGRNGGQVNPGLKLDPDTVERDFGAALGARMNALAGAAPGLVFDLIERHRIACEPRRNGTLRAAVHDRQTRALRRLVEQWTRRGAPVEYLGREAMRERTGTDRYAGALLDRRGGDLNPLSYVRGLARAATEIGARVHAASRVESMRRDGDRWHLATARGTVTSPHVVLATNGYTDDLWPSLRRTVVPLFGAVAASEPLPHRARALIMPSRSVLYETGAVTVYYRVDAAGRLLIGGRGPLREVESERPIAHLTAYARSLWPSLEGVRWTHVWSGRLAMTQDHYPHVHEPLPGLHACLGYNGRGVAMATALGAALAGRIARPGLPFDMPLSDLRPIAMHRCWPAAVKTAILLGRMRDGLGV